MITLTNDIKYDILKKIYEFMFSEMRGFRATMLRIILPYNGVLFIVTGWLFSKKTSIDTTSKILFTVAIILFSCLVLFIISTLKRYFLNIARIINKIDNIFKLFEKNEYLEDRSLFPAEWNTFGQKGWKEPIFDNSRLTIVFTSLFCMAAVWIVL